MPSLPQKLRILIQKANFPALLAVSMVFASCTYRFSNSHITKPDGIKTIAIEAVFDTSREVLPHELLWGNLQKAFARDGHLMVVKQENADALLRAHIYRAATSPTGGFTTTLPTTEKDPKVFNRKSPSAPSNFKQLLKAGEFTTKKNMSIGVQIQVFNLRTKKMIFHHNYQIAGNYPSVKSSRVGSVTTMANDFVRSEESLQNTFNKTTESLANKVVADLLVN